MKKLPLSFLFEFAQVDEALRKVYFAEFAAHGVKHLVLSSPLMNMLASDRELMKKLPQEMAEFGLTFGDGHFPYSEHQNFNCVYPAERRSLELRIKMYINIAALLGVKTMTLHLGNDCFYPGTDLQQLLDQSCRTIEAVLDEARACNVIMCVENIHARPSAVKNIVRIVQKFDSPNLGLCYDSGHANLMDKGRNCEYGEAHKLWRGKDEWAGDPEWEDIAVIHSSMQPYVVNCHLHDNDGVWDLHTMPGRGNVNWTQVADFLENAPRLQAMQSEVHIFRNQLSIGETVESFRRIAFMEQSEQ